MEKGNEMFTLQIARQKAERINAWADTFFGTNAENWNEGIMYDCDGLLKDETLDRLKDIVGELQDAAQRDVMLAERAALAAMRKTG